MDVVIDKHGQEIPIRKLEDDQIGVRMQIFLGEDENGECYGDPPMMNLDICYSCYEGYVQGNEREWIPSMGEVYINGIRNRCLDESELAGRTLNELFEEGQSWEWDALNGDGSFIFRGEGYTCNECGEGLLDGVYNLDDGKKRPTLWDNERNQQVSI